MLVAAFAVSFTQSWQLTLTMLGLVFITLGLIGFIVGSDQKIEGTLLKHYSECSPIAEDALGSIKTVVAFGAAHKFIAKYDTILKQAEKVGKKKGPLTGLMFACQYFFMFSGWALSFYLGVYLYNRGNLKDPGSIIAVFFAMLIGLGAIMALGPRMPDFIKATSAAGIIFAVLEEQGDQDKDENASEDHTPNLGTCNGHLELRSCSFSYPSRPDRNVLDDINLEFKKGTTTAIVGPSGAGKSTLISLLERWYRPTTGGIFLDGLDTSTTSLKWLRSQMALVQQEPQLFNSSIYENVAYGLVGTQYENLSRDEKLRLVQEATRESRAYDFIMALDHGFDTSVGDHGSLLSGGQKQRIAIARALVGKRPILLMDEATSALDNENSIVIESLMTTPGERTVLFISHKILSAKQADRIVVIDGGKITEQGTHEELIHMDGLYKRLHDTHTKIEADANAAGPIEKASLQTTSTAYEQPSAAPDVTKDPTDISPARKRSLVANLLTIAAEQKKYWPLLLASIIACVVTAQLFPVQAILLGKVLQTFSGPQDHFTRDANFWALMFFVVGVAALIAYAVLGYFMTLLGVLLSTYYRHEYFRAILHQEMSLFDSISSGAMVLRLSTDPSNLHELISMNLGLLVSVFVSIISASIISLAFEWKLALVTMFGALPVVFAAGYIRMKVDGSLAEVTSRIFEESARFASDALSSIRTVKAFTLEDTVQSSYQSYLSGSVKGLYKQTATLMLFFAFSESAELLAAALAFWYGGKLLSQGETSVGKFFTVFMAVIVGGQAAGALFGFSSSMSVYDMLFLLY